MPFGITIFNPPIVPIPLELNRLRRRSLLSLSAASAPFSPPFFFPFSRHSSTLGSYECPSHGFVRLNLAISHRPRHREARGRIVRGTESCSDEQIARRVQPGTK